MIIGADFYKLPYCGRGLSVPFSFPFPCAIFPLFSSLSLHFTAFPRGYPLNPAAWSGERCKLPQWVRMKLGCQIVSSVLYSDLKSQLSWHCVEDFFVIMWSNKCGGLNFVLAAETKQQVVWWQTIHSLSRAYLRGGNGAMSPPPRMATHS